MSHSGGARDVAVRPSRHAPAWCSVLAVFALHAGGAYVASAQVSPGPLARQHADLEGTMKCFNCHPRPGAHESMDDRCIACHQEIGAMRSAQRGFHASVANRKCATCHPEHAGREFHLIAWEGGGPAAFDHRQAGWPLDGGHQKAECRSCHRPELQASPIASKLKVRDRHETWLALETRCSSCHEDEHRGQLGDDCAHCHTARAWTPASGFDHAATGYPLTGKHVEVKCAKCHAAENETAAPRARGRAGLVSAHAPGSIVATARYKPVAHAECSPCHRDPHTGRFGAACAKCHTTRDFHTIQERTFNHDVTRYPLRGRHVSVACVTCHDPKRAWGERPAFNTCDACHRDAHAGKAKADCALCHGVEGFRPSTYTVALHQKSTYPLAGAHGSAACEACHARASGAVADLGVARVALRPPHGACADCHDDPHRGRLTPAAGGREPACLDCHDMRRFVPSSVDVAAHQRYEFHLEGAHRAAPCQACHAELRAAPAASTLRDTPGRPLTFREPKARCADCHATPHDTQFDRNRKGGACETCHDLEAFRPASRFDHNRDAAFHLDGAHAPVACALCHRSEAGPRGPRVIWKPVASGCENCHARDEATPATRLRKTVELPAPTEARGEEAAAAKRASAPPPGPVHAPDAKAPPAGAADATSPTPVGPRREAALSPVPPSDPKDARVIADFALDASLFRTGSGAPTEWPVGVRTDVERARRRSDRAAARHSAVEFDQAADEWERVQANAGDGLPELEARYHAAESRYLAWRLDPTRQRARTGFDALTSFLVRAPQGAARDSAACWADRLKR